MVAGMKATYGALGLHVNFSKKESSSQVNSRFITDCLKTIVEKKDTTHLTANFISALHYCIEAQATSKMRSENINTMY